MLRSLIIIILSYSSTSLAQTEGLDWLFSQPVSVSAVDQEVTYQLKIKLKKESHIRILKSLMTGDNKYVVSDSMAYTDPSGYTEFQVKIKHPDHPIQVWIVDKLTGYAKPFLWQPGTNMNAPASLLAQQASGSSAVAIDLKGKKPEWKVFPRSFSLGLNLGPVGYTTEIASTNTALDFKVDVAPRGTMQYWHNFKNSPWKFQFKGSLQQVSIQDDAVFAAPSDESSLLYAGETNAWYKLRGRYSLGAGLKLQRDVFLAREDDGGSIVAALQEQSLGKMRFGASADIFNLCKHCESRVTAVLDMLLFSSGDRDFDSYMGFEMSYDISWRWKEHWKILSGIGYRFQNYSFTAIDEVASQNLATESQTSDISLGLGAAYLF